MKNIIKNPTSKAKKIIRLTIAIIMLIIIAFLVISTISFYISGIVLLLAMFSPYIIYEYHKLKTKRKENKHVH